MTDKIQGGEFTDREVQRPPEDTAGGIAQAPATARAQSDLADTPLGAPPADYDVRSVYDSRPVNGYDFNITVTAAAEGGNTFTLEFTVRQGFVAVFRRFGHFFTDAPLPAIVNRAECLLSIRKNGTDVPDNVDFPIGLASDDLWNGFVIADEFDTITARVVLQGALTATELVGTFYGNYLLKTGRAWPFEIANPSAVKFGHGDPAPVIVREIMRPVEPPPQVVMPVPVMPAPVRPAPTPPRGPFVAHGARTPRPRR